MKFLTVNFAIVILTSLCMEEVLGTCVPEKRTTPQPQLEYISFEPPKDRKIPKTFDSRIEWPMCTPVMNKVWNQGRCGSCWAFSTSYIMTVRSCIQTKGKFNLTLSAEDLLTCCERCKIEMLNPCGGGHTLFTFEYWKREGIVTGGPYGSKEGCMPYSSKSYEYNEDAEANMPRECNKICRDGYNIPYENDKYFGELGYEVPNDMKTIQLEILVNGPVAVVMNPYENFLSYTGGIYKTAGGAPKGSHGVVLIGWGEEDGVLYWLGVNSWGNKWGENGFFKILRGVNFLAVETFVTAAKSKLKFDDAPDINIASSTFINPVYLVFFCFVISLITNTM